MILARRNWAVGNEESILVSAISNTWVPVLKSLVCFMNNPTFHLSEVHRQAPETPGNLVIKSNYLFVGPVLL